MQEYETEETEETKQSGIKTTLAVESCLGYLFSVDIPEEVSLEVDHNNYVSLLTENLQ